MTVRLDAAHRPRHGPALFRHHCHPVIGNAGSCNGGDFGMVIGWRNFHKVHPDEVQRIKTANKFQALPAGQPADHGGAGAGGKSRVQPGNIKR